MMLQSDEPLQSAYQVEPGRLRSLSPLRFVLEYATLVTRMPQAPNDRKWPKAGFCQMAFIPLSIHGNSPYRELTNFLALRWNAA